MSARQPTTVDTQPLAAPSGDLHPDAPVPLSEATRARWSARLPGARYARAQTVVGVAHVGVGGFHRAHQAAYHDRLLAAGRARDWAICGVGVLPGDRAMQEALRAQDGLYVLVERAGDGTERARVVGAITDVLHAPREHGRAVELLAAPSTRIVSLTITEGGYGGDADPAAFALIAEALALRRARGTGPVTVMSCDNLEGNGALARAGVLRAAAEHGDGLDAWADEHLAFPSSAVDRITPATTDADRAHVADRHGVADRWPVVCEPWTWWILEDRFAAGRPPYEEVGVRLVDDVRPYEVLKLRMLNAGHQALAYFARLCGFAYAHEAAADPAFRDFLLGYLTEEAAPTLPEVPGVDVPAYAHALLERFANPALRDPVRRLCADGSDRIPGFLLPVVREQLRRGGPVARSAAVVASWARYVEGVDEQGAPIEVVDRRAAELTARARRGRTEPTAFLRTHDVFGDLAEHPPFVEAYVRALRSLHERGARATVDAFPTLEVA